MQDGEVRATQDKKAGASKSSGGSWRSAVAERPKEAKADFQRSADQQDSPGRRNPLTELTLTASMKQTRAGMLEET